MSDEDNKGKPASNDQKNVGVRVQLRSDDGGSGKTNFMGGQAGWSKWLIAGAILAGLVLVGAVTAVLVIPGKKATTSDNNVNPFFGALPESEDSQVRSSISGLSGRECSDANRRPIGVMLASDVITRPVSGFAEADMVWELPVLVSDVTRLLAVYQCGRPDDIGSVRSARHDYLFLAEGVDAIMAHWGGSYHALNRISAGEFKTINALTNPFGAYFRKDSLPAPYNGFTSYENLWNALGKLGYRTETTFKGYRFKDDGPVDERPAGGTLNIGWPGAFSVRYEYDPETNKYVRFWGGTKQVEGGDKTREITPSVVAIMRAGNGFADGPGGYNDVDIEGEGALEVYQDGIVIKGRWKKNELQKTDPVHFLDEQGKNIEFTKGQVWVMAVEPEISVTWEAEQLSTEAADGVEAPTASQ